MKNIKKILYYSKISLACIVLSACQLDVKVADSDGSEPIDDGTTPIISDDRPLNNTPPQINGSPEVRVMSGSEYLFIPSSSDGDGDNLTFSIEGQPGWLEFNATTGRVWGTPSSEYIGSTYSDIIITVSDGVESSYISFSISVVASNASGGILNLSGTPEIEVTIGQMYNFSPVATRTIYEELSYSISNMPPWATFNLTTGNLSGVPAIGDDGSYEEIVVSVSGSSGSFAMLPSFDITVLSDSNPNPNPNPGPGPGPNSAPTISGSPALVAHEGFMYEFIPTSSDLDGDELTFSIEKKPNWLSFNVETGELSGTPTPADKGLYQDIVISVSDSDETVSLPSMAVMVKSTTVTLAWVAPTARADDTPIDMIDIGGFRVYAGNNLDNMSLVAEINDSLIDEYELRNVKPGTRFFTVSAYDIDGLESSFSDALNIDI